MCRQKSLFLVAILSAIAFIISCNLDANREFSQDLMENDALLTEDRCIGNNTELSNIDIINNFLNDLERGKSYKLFSYLANDIEWIVAGNQEKVPFAGTYNRIKAVNRYLKYFYRTVKITDLVTTTLTEPEPDYLEAYIRLQGKIRSTGKTIDIEFLYTWQLNEKRRIEKITVAYPLVSLELAFTRGGKGQIVADLSASETALYITNTVLPTVKQRIGSATTAQQLRSTYTAPALPSDAVLEQKQINGVPVDIVHIIGEREDKIIFHMHGGGFVSGSKLQGRLFDYRFAKELNIPAMNIDYRLAPENPFSAGLEDCYAVYCSLLNQYEPENIILLGESAGGNLVLAVMLLAKQNNMPLPGAVLALSPWVDLTNSSETITTNADSDTYIPIIYLNNCANWYLNGTSPLDPIASPLYGDVAGFPPIYLSATCNEILLSDSTRMFNKLANNGVDVTIELASNLCHVFAGICFGTTDAERSIARMLDFIKDKVDIE